MNRKIIYVVLIAIVACSCISSQQPDDNTPIGNFEALWSTLDERYCYFTEKGIDWDSIHTVYYNRVKTIGEKDEIELFDTLSCMVNELRDGHVNLISPFDVSRYKFYEQYEHNYSSEILYSKYLNQYRSVGGFDYGVIDQSYGYIRYSSFSAGFNNLNLRYILSEFEEKQCKGLIVDVRDNTGGDLTNALWLASLFFDKDTIIGYTRHKIGKGHEQFSEAQPIRIEKQRMTAEIGYDGPVVVLVNRRCYSATNTFACAMKQAPRCTLVGDTTGGGGGLPLSYELPNGWLIRFSSVRMTDIDDNSIEQGIAPDIRVSLKSDDKDELIEKAKEIID